MPQSPPLVRRVLALAAFLIAGLQAPAWAAPDDCPGAWYGAGKKRICLPLGAASFADRVVSFTPGARPSEAPFDNPAAALGEPDYQRTSRPDFVSLGCDGTLVLAFADNVLVDVDGMDLYVFEVGPYVEETELAISADGRDWRVVGRIEGARADVDIASVARPGERFRFVRLRNVGRKGCGGRHSGADIDAVAAVGAELRLSFDAAVLFDVGQAELRPQAQAELATAAARLNAMGSDIRVTVEGHTDSTGSDADNLRLSEARARAVWAHLAAEVALPAAAVTIRGLGESRPVAGNDSDEGHALNRRVELLVAPGRGR
ncbi:MAG: OmpA family protein [Rubrivivax sp.]|nr:OmpA family protein [Rubrivivax sp.]